MRFPLAQAAAEQLKWGLWWCRPPPQEGVPGYSAACLCRSKYPWWKGKLWHFFPSGLWRRAAAGSLDGQARQRRWPSIASRRPCPGSGLGCGRGAALEGDEPEVGMQFVGPPSAVSYAVHARRVDVGRQMCLPSGRLLAGQTCSQCVHVVFTHCSRSVHTHSMFA